MKPVLEAAKNEEVKLNSLNLKGADRYFASSPIRADV